MKYYIGRADTIHSNTTFFEFNRSMPTEKFTRNALRVFGVQFSGCKSVDVYPIVWCRMSWLFVRHPMVKTSSVSSRVTLFVRKRELSETCLFLASISNIELSF